MKGIAEIPQSNTIAVRVLIASNPEALSTDDVEFIDLVGSFREHEDDGAQHSVGNENNSLDDQQSNNKSATNLEVVDTKKIVVFDLDFNSIKSVKWNEAAYMTVKLSLNEYDYSAPLPSNKSVILHAFEPSSLMPACYALDSEANASLERRREVCVLGNGFISSLGLRAGSSIEAVLRAKVGKAFGEVVLPLQCYNGERIYFVPPTVAQFVAASGQVVDPSSMPTLLNALVRFQLNSPPEIHAASNVHSRATTATASNPSLLDNSHSSAAATDPEIIQLSSTVLKLDLYTPQPVRIQPEVCRRVPGILLTLTGTLKGGIKLRSNQSKVLFSNPDVGVEYYCDAEFIRMIPAGDVVTDEVFTSPQVMEEAPTPGMLTERTTTPFEDPSNPAPNTEAKKAKGKGKKSRATEVQPVEIEVEYKAVLKLPEPDPAFDALYEAYVNSTDENKPPLSTTMVPNWKVMNTVNVSLMLDGQTAVPASYAATMVLFDTLGIKPLPKGPFAPASVLTLEVMGLVRTNMQPDEDGDVVKCIVRFHAEASAATRTPSCEVVCTGSVTAQTITITLPDAAQFASLEPDPTSKAAKAKGPKNFFIGISIDDGNTFDYSDKAILPVK